VVEAERPETRGLSTPPFRALVASLLFVALVIILGTFAFADPPRYAAGISRIEIDATPITSFDNRDASLTRFGDLEFRGGLVLASNNPAFGGLSGRNLLVQFSIVGE
jgi:hypothetical protein